MHAENNVEVLHPPPTDHSCAHSTLSYASLLPPNAVVQTCKKKFACESGNWIPTAGVAEPTGQSTAVAKVFSLKQTSCFKKVDDWLASAAATLCTFTAVASLGTTTTVDWMWSVFVPVASFAEILTFCPTAYYFDPAVLVAFVPHLAVSAATVVPKFNPAFVPFYLLTDFNFHDAYTVLDPTPNDWRFDVDCVASTLTFYLVLSGV